MRKLFIAWLLASCCVLAQSTYYVSFSTGADTNTSTQAKSKATPWKNLKYMTSATSNAASYTVVAGDTFILMGCDDWPNASFPINWAANGTSGAHITIGIDQTWYNTTNCPSSWNRPVFDAGGSVMGGVECTGNNYFIYAGSSVFVDFNWIELKGLFWSSPNVDGSCQGKEGWVHVSNSAQVTINNFYVHAWTIAGCGVGTCSVHTAGDISTGIYGSCSNCKVDYLVADNSDGTWYTGIGDQWPVTHSIFKYVSNAVKPFSFTGEIGYNDISNVGISPGSGGGTVHSNCIETVGSGGTFYIHDNRIHDNLPCEGLQIGNPGETDYVWNNLWYNMTGSGANGPDIPQNCSTGVNSIYYWNNTNVDQRNSCLSCATCSGSNWTGSVVMQNNHCITAGTPGGTTQSQKILAGCTISGASTITFSGNLAESLATANGQGYTNAQTYVYSPTTGSSPTVGAGNNLTGSLPPSPYSTYDTTYACSEQTISGVVQSVCPQRTANARPGSGAWDIGAYEFATSQAVTPSCTPGSGTYTTNQTVTCTNPNSGTTVMCYSTSTTPATNGSGTGCTTGTQYTTALSITANTTLNVIAGTSTLTDSAVVTYSYVLQGGAPVCSPVGGTYIGTQSVALSQPQSLAIGYTTNGTSPVSNGSGGCSGSCTLYSGAISVASSETIKSIGMASGWTDSSIASCSYVINAPAATDMTMKGVTSSQGVTIVQ